MIVSYSNHSPTQARKQSCHVYLTKTAAFNINALACNFSINSGSHSYASNAVDVFYFGLTLSQVLAYTLSLITASSLTFLLSIFTFASVKRVIAITFSVSLAIAFGNFVGMLVPQARLLFKPHGGVVDGDYFSYALSGSLLGFLNGFGNASLFAKAMKVDSKTQRAAIFAVIILTITIISGITSTLQKFGIASMCMGLGIAIQIMTRRL